MRDLLGKLFIGVCGLCLALVWPYVMLAGRIVGRWPTPERAIREARYIDSIGVKGET